MRRAMSPVEVEKVTNFCSRQSALQSTVTLVEGTAATGKTKVQNRIGGCIER